MRYLRDRKGHGVPSQEDAMYALVIDYVIGPIIGITMIGGIIYGGVRALFWFYRLF